MRKYNYEFKLIRALPWRFEKKLYVKKVISLISYENSERKNFFSTQARSEILFDFKFKCHEEL